MKTRIESERPALIQSKHRATARAIAFLLLLPLAAWSGGFVTTCTEADLRAAMAGGGLVTFACDGTIILGAYIRCDVDTTLDGTGHQIIIRSPTGIPKFVVSNGVKLTMLKLVLADGWGVFNDGGTLSLGGVEFRTNSIALSQTSGPPYMADVSGMGAAIYNRNGWVVATNCLFYGNKAQVGYPYYARPARGGAIYSESGQLNLFRCRFEGNAAYGGAGESSRTAPTAGAVGVGGAVAAMAGTVTVEQCAFVGNTATGGGGGSGFDAYGPAGAPGGAAWGGAIYHQGLLVVKQTTFSVNQLTGGGGGWGAPSKPGAGGGAGGGAAGSAIYSSGQLQLESSTLADNLLMGGAGGGGGSGGPGTPGHSDGAPGGVGGNGGLANGSALWIGGTGSVVNCTFGRNSASGGAGGIGGAGGYPFGNGGKGGIGGHAAGALYVNSASLALTNCTIAFNTGDGGLGGSGGVGSGGSYPGQPGAPGTNGVALAGGVSGNSLATINTLLAANSPTNASGVITDSGHNLSSDSSCAFTNTGSLNNTDPKVGPLADNGGPTLTMALLPGSLAIDAGDNASAPATDQRGVLRPVGSFSDIGAYEFTAVLEISQTPESGINVLVHGPRSQLYRLLASTNLSDWQCVATNQIGTNGTALFQDNCGTGETQRFYKVALP